MMEACTEEGDTAGSKLQVIDHVLNEVTCAVGPLTQSLAKRDLARQRLPQQELLLLLLATT